MSTRALALLEALLVFGGALAFALHQLYQLRADKRRSEEAPKRRQDSEVPKAPEAPKDQAKPEDGPPRPG